MGFLVIIDIEKAFDSLNHKFILPILKKFDFVENFVSWVEALLNNQESYVIMEASQPDISLCNEVHARGTLLSVCVDFIFRNFIYPNQK